MSEFTSLKQIAATMDWPRELRKMASYDQHQLDAIDVMCVQCGRRYHVTNHLRVRAWRCRGCRDHPVEAERLERRGQTSLVATANCGTLDDSARLKEVVV